jgi:E3 ubiquitin-protein ligase DOA10
MNEFLAQIIAGIVGAALGAASAIALFRSRLDTHSQALETFSKQRTEDRETDRRENDRMRIEFRDLCTNQNNERARELQFIQREVADFRNQIASTDRRQRAILDIVSAIARKHGVNHRLTDIDHYGEENGG